MALITEKCDVKQSFLREWAKFVPAIIACARKSTKLGIRAVFAEADSGNYIFESTCTLLKHGTSKVTFHQAVANNVTWHLFP